MLELQSHRLTSAIPIANAEIEPTMPQAEDTAPRIFPVTIDITIFKLS